MSQAEFGLYCTIRRQTNSQTSQLANDYFLIREILHYVYTLTLILIIYPIELD